MGINIGNNIIGINIGNNMIGIVIGNNIIVINNPIMIKPIFTVFFVIIPI